ncbi:MAG: hypothetical protein JXM69_13420 [Anaerolineae bacterium]|nr:hypothetical protein [Anaerolineae bacterium]
MSHRFDDSSPPPLGPQAAIIIGTLISIGLVFAVQLISQLVSPGPPVAADNPAAVAIAPDASVPAAQLTVAPNRESDSSPDATPGSVFTVIATSIPTNTPTPINTPSPTVTPTPTLNLAKCNAAGCGLEAKPLPTREYDYNLLLTYETPTRRVCPECPRNETLLAHELDQLIAADRATLAHLRTIALSQEPYQLAPGIIYLVFNNVHHVVIDLEESGYVFRNIIPRAERGTLITPSYCLSQNSLVVIDADYHGLNGSNKTETGEDWFFHLGRAALFQRDGQFDIDVIRTRAEYDPTTISWGGGPIFIWDGVFNFNPKQEWFDEDNLDYYRTTRWAKISAALSQDRKYLFLTASFGLTIDEHAENIIELGQRWGIKIDRAMRFDGGESAYLAIRLGDYLVPVLNIEEPLIVNCLAVERR